MPDTTDTNTADTAEVSRTVAALGEAVTQELDATYTLVYADGSLPKDVVAALVRGDDPWETKGGERLDEWASETAYLAACREVDELAKDIVNQWEGQDDADYSSLLEHDWPVSDERDAAVDTVRDRDDSTWYTDMVTQHGAVLLRVGIDAMDEDAGLSFTPMTPQEFLDLLGFEHTDHNLELADEVVGNASPEFSVVMGYALLGVDLADFLTMPTDADRVVELRNPFVWLGSACTGSGWCSQEPFTGTLRVARGELRTDDDAFGWSWDKVVGGVSPADFTDASLVVIEPDADSPAQP